MSISRKDDLKMKIGNLITAIWLATVPTVITYGVFGLYGLNICNTYAEKIDRRIQPEENRLCNDAVWETTTRYIFLIGLFITMPTWYWFYISMKKQRNKIDN